VAPLRRIVLCAVGALCIGLGTISLLTGFSADPPLRLLQALAVFGAGAAVLGGAIAFAVVTLGGWREPEDEAEFEAIVRRTERLAAQELSSPAEDPSVFARALRSALDDLPAEFHRALEHVAVVVSDEGWRHGAYGLYQGDTVAQDHFHDRIVIFRDTLARDFGHDPELLARQVRRTLRHELAHHLGWDENGVRGLGL
jgi:predicted Zn-dependent protease with MMP-like domain